MLRNRCCHSGGYPPRFLTEGRTAAVRASYRHLNFSGSPASRTHPRPVLTEGSTSGHTAQTSAVRPRDLAGDSKPRIVEEHHIARPRGEDEVAAIADCGRRWYHLRSDPRRRADLLGFNHTWWTVPAIIQIVWLIFPWWSWPTQARGTRTREAILSGNAIHDRFTQSASARDHGRQAPGSSRLTDVCSRAGARVPGVSCFLRVDSQASAPAPGRGFGVDD